MGNKCLAILEKEEKKPLPLPKKQSFQSKQNLELRGADIVGEIRDNILSYYIFDTVLGEGSFGKVYKAKHKQTGKIRAVKQIKQFQSSQIENLKKEVRILKNLVNYSYQSHPNIMKIIQSFIQSDKMFIVSQLYQGGQMFDRIIKLTHYSQNQAREVMKQILSAINYLHSNKIVHRDLKPQNILYETKNAQIIRICDFGTSSRFTNRHLKQFIGTVTFDNQPYYIAPQVLNRDYTQKCDIWSCGVIFYILLTGIPPFNGNSEGEIMQKIRLGEYSMNSSKMKKVSTQAKDLIQKMLQKNPIIRFSSQRCLSHPWFSHKSSTTNLTDAIKDISYLRVIIYKQKFTKLQQASYMFLVHHNSSKQDQKKLVQHFKALDKNNDGKLSKMQLAQGYKSKKGNFEAGRIVDEIFDQYDIDKTGYLDYNEFIMASLKKQKIINQKTIKDTFKLIDRDGNGEITVDELNFMLGGKGIDQNLWKNLIDKADQNKDGKISLSQFQKMMLQLI